MAGPTSRRLVRGGIRLAAILPLLVSAGCSSKPSPAAAADPPAVTDAPPSYVYQVTYKPGVAVVDRATVAASLQDMSDDGATFTFDASAAGMDQLQPGAVVLVWGLALRKVTSVDTQGSMLVVQTDPAAISEAIQDGTIHWDQSIDFTQGGSGNFVTSGSGVVPDQGADAGVAPPRSPRSERRRWWASAGTEPQDFGISLKAGEATISGSVDGYDYELTFTPTPGKLEVDATLTKKTSGLEITISAKGFVNKFRTSADIEVKDGTTVSASVDNSSIVGQLDLSFEAGKPTNDASSEQVILKVPFSFKIPIPMPGGFPAFVQVSAGFAVTMALTSTNASASGTYSIPFHGSAGFALPQGSAEDTASADMDSNPSIGDGTTTESLGVSAMAVQVGFPHVGVGVGISELQTVAYVSQVTSAVMKTPGELGLMHCQAHSLSLSTEVGASATVLGLTFNSETKQVYNKEVQLTLPPGVNCN